MSKVDDSSDAQRIREMNEAQFRRRTGNDKRAQQSRLDKNFTQVMANKATRAQAQEQTGRQAKPTAEKQAARQVLEKVRAEQPKAPHELARRAALSKAMHGDLSKTRKKDTSQAQQVDTARVEDLTTKTEAEVEHVDKTAREDDDRDVQRTDEQQSEIEQAKRHDGPVAAVGEDDQRRQPRQGQGQGGGDERRSEGVAGPQGAAGANPAKLPPEVIKQIVGAIYKGVAQDGRTHMQITLKGGMLDGVQLQIRAENGKVRCDFSGCGKDLSRLLESTRGVLARGLGRRGLQLDALSAR